jgi:hypothetical protein
VTIAEEYGIPPEILAQVEDARALHAKMRPILDIIEAQRPVLDIIERQREAMETMRSSFELAMRVLPPPATRQAIADMVRYLREDPPTAAVLVAQARSASPAVAAFVGQDLTPDQAEEVRQGVEEIEADPELSGKIRRVVERVDWAAVGTLTPWGLLCVAWVLLSQLADQAATAAQAAALSNQLAVLIVVTTLASLIITIQKK